MINSSLSRITTSVVVIPLTLLMLWAPQLPLWSAGTAELEVEAKTEAAADSGMLQASVSILPQRHFVRQVAGETVQVVVELAPLKPNYIENMRPIAKAIRAGITP